MATYKLPWKQSQKQPTVGKKLRVPRNDVIAAIICNTPNLIDHVAGNRGAPSGDPTPGASPTGRNLDLDGSSDFIEWSTGAPYAITGTEFAAFVRCKMDSTSGLHMLFTNYQGSPNDPTYNWAIQIFDGDLYSSFGAGNSDKDYTPGGGLDTGVWMNLCVGYDGTTQFVYRDGLLLGSSTGNSGQTLDFDVEHQLNVGSGSTQSGFTNGRIEVVTAMNTWPGDDFVKAMNRNPYMIFEEEGAILYTVDPSGVPAGAIMNQIQGSNLGADLFNGTFQ